VEQKELKCFFRSLFSHKQALPKTFHPDGSSIFVILSRNNLRIILIYKSNLLSKIFKLFGLDFLLIVIFKSSQLKFHRLNNIIAININVENV
jgi:hypothetical protein